MNKKQIVVITMVIFMLAIVTACSNKNSNQELKTLDDIKQNIEAEGLSISSVDIPSELISTKAENQAGYEIGNSGDEIFIYEYNNSEILNEDRTKIHNNLNEFSTPNTPIEMVNYNIYMIYLKKDSNSFEIENNILRVL
jgi:hypothetical protein